MKVMNATWLTTFGDVLTLLLSFILVVMYTGSKPQPGKDQQIHTVKQESRASSKSSEAIGKPFASKLVSEYRQQSVGFDAEDFDQNEKILNFQGLSKLTSLGAADLQRFELRICNFGQGYVESLFKQISGSRKLQTENLKTWEIFSGQQACKTAELQKGEVESIKPIVLTAWFKNG